MSVAPAGLGAKGRATRSRLLSVAGDHLARDGALEVAGVADAAGVAQSVLYRYFDGRDQLVTAVVDGFYDAYDEHVFARRDLPGDTWRQREATRMRREVAFFYDHPLGAAVAGGMLREPAAAAVDAQRTRAQAKAAARNIRAGRRAGELPDGVDAELAGAAIIGAVRAMLADALARTPPARPDDVVAAGLSVGAAVLA